MDLIGPVIAAEVFAERDAGRASRRIVADLLAGQGDGAEQPASGES